MKKYLLLAPVVLLCWSAAAQRIETDVFGDLQSEDRGRTAALKKDIFDTLIYTDSQGNELKFEKKYLETEYRGLPENLEARIDFFRDLMRRYRNENGYKATYSVDILNKIVISDNRGRRVEMGTDLSGRPTYEERSGGVTTSIKRDIMGNLECRSGGRSATLGKDVFGKWTYKDGSGNKFEFSPVAWDRLLRRFGSEDEVFGFLLREYY